VDRCKVHPLVEIVTIALCGMLCGADDWVAIEAFRQEKEEWLRTFLRLPGGIPSHDTVGRVFARLDPAYLAYVDPADAWAQLRSVILIESTRRVGDTVTMESRHYLASLAADAPPR
jgi:DDE_Tnp_1-associated